MKSILALLILTLFHHHATSQYLNEEKELKIDNDGCYYKNDQVFNGLVFNRYTNNQIKSIYGVKNGVLYGEYRTYYLDSVFSREQFQDTIVLNKLLVEKSLLDKSLSELMKDTLLSYNELNNFISEDAGGIKKWEKIQSKAIEGNLKEDAKTLWDRGQSLINNHIYKKNNFQQKIVKLENLLKDIDTQKSKPLHIGKISEIEVYQGSGSQPNRIVGPYISFHMNGQKKMEKIYETSTTTHYDQNGNKQLEETGIEKRYYINNMLSRVVTKNKTIIYEEGRKHRVEFKNPNENIQIDSTFYASGLISKVEEWQDNKKIKISIFNEMGKLIQLTYHYSLVEDETAYYQKLAYNKREIFYYENGKKKLESTYLDDLKNGLEIAYYETGNLERETLFLKGKKHENEISYWNHTTEKPIAETENYTTEIEKIRKNARIKTLETFNNGLLSERIIYDSLGRRKEFNAIKNNKNQGAFELYFPSGAIKYKGNIDTLSKSKDHFFGDYFEYNEQGDILIHFYYRTDGRYVNKRSTSYYFGEKFPEEIIGNPFRLGSIEIAEFDFPVYAGRMFNLEFLNNTCASLGEGWRLPTKDELKLIYDSLCVSNKSIFHDGKNYNLYLTGETFSKTILKENVLVGLGRPPQDREETITYYVCLQFVSPSKQPNWVNQFTMYGEINKSAVRAVRTIEQ